MPGKNYRAAPIGREEGEIRAEALGIGMERNPRGRPRENQAPAPESEADPDPGIELVATRQNVVRVCDASGRPTLAIMPWDAYQKLLRAATDAGRKTRGRPRKDRDIYPSAYAKGSSKVGRPPVQASHILRELIRDNPDSSSAKIADLFLQRTGVKVNRNTVHRYRHRLKDGRQSAPAPAPASGRPGLVVNGVDLGEYDAVIYEAAIRAGARPDAARESEEYADGLVALYEAAEDFDASGDGRFLGYASERIRRGIARGREDRKVTVEGKSGRVLNFSEIGDDDFDIAALIDDSGQLA